MAQFLILACFYSVGSEHKRLLKDRLWNLLSCYTTWHSAAFMDHIKFHGKLLFLSVFFLSFLPWWGQVKEIKEFAAELNLEGAHSSQEKALQPIPHFQNYIKGQQRKFVDSDVTFHIWQSTRSVISYSSLLSHVSIGNEAWSNHKMVTSCSKRNSSSSLQEKSASNFSISKYTEEGFQYVTTWLLKDNCNPQTPQSHSCFLGFFVLLNSPGGKQNKSRGGCISNLSPELVVFSSIIYFKISI